MQCVLDMCDIQAITSLAILMSGFISLKHTDAPLTASDWQMLVYLVWFSTSTHLAGLTSLRAYLNARPRLKISRLILISLLLCWLLVAMVPTGFFDWGSFSKGYKNHVPSPLSPAICYFDLTTARSLWLFSVNRGHPEVVSMIPHPLMETPAMQAMIVGEVVLVVGFLSRCIKLSPVFSHRMIRYAHEPIAKFATWSVCWLVSLAEDPTPGRTRHGLWLQRVWTDFVILPTVGLYLCLRWTTEMFSSMLAEVSPMTEPSLMQPSAANKPRIFARR